MKIMLTLLCLLVYPVIATAQDGGMNNIDMQKMGQAIQEIMQCMGQIDQAELAALEEKSEKFDQELKELCSQGKRSEAQKRAIDFSKKIMNEPALKQMQKCAEINKKYGIPMDETDDSPFSGDDFETSGHHVCDELDEE